LPILSSIMRLATSGRTPSQHVAELEARIAALEVELEHQRRLAKLGTLAGAIGHELNNILTPVLGHAEIARGTPFDRELVARSLSRIVSGVDRAAKVAEAILALAEPTKLRPNKAAADVRQTVRSALETLPTEQESKGLTTSIDVAPETWAAIDSIALHQVVVNIASNAHRAMGPCGTLTVRCKQGSCSTGNRTRSNEIILEIEDTGSGMPAHVVERIFEPFVSFPDLAAPDMPPGGQGKKAYGLGLAICRQLIEHAGGTISVRSRVGEGTCFTIRLPAVTQTRSAAA
jgi:signal transduction histidine kinase